MTREEKIAMALVTDVEFLSLKDLSLLLEALFLLERLVRDEHRDDVINIIDLRRKIFDSMDALTEGIAEEIDGGYIR